MKSHRSSRRGFAMLAAIMVMMLLAIISIAVLTSAGASRRRAVRDARGEVRENCAMAGLNYAKTYFAQRIGSWNTFFSTPGFYNPMIVNGAGNGGYGWDPTNTTVYGTVKSARPELFIDLDSDGRDDAVIFIRDNYDEYPPMPQVPANFQVDNDQNAIVGALCVSQTMQPRREDGTIDTDALVMEALLQVNTITNQYCQLGQPCQ